MDFSADAVQEQTARMDLPNEEYIVVNIQRKVKQCCKWPPTYTIFPIPDVFFGIDDWIQSPQLASFGPHHRGKKRLLLFEEYKKDFLSLFLSRPENNEPGKVQGKDFYVKKLKGLKEKTKGCYSERIKMPPNDEELVDMMLHDGSFMVELFRKYEENRGVTRWPWLWPIQTLIADLLKLENQIPFFILEELFECSKNQSVPTTDLPTLAFRFLNQAFCSPSDVINSKNQDHKHLLDLFRSSLLPSTVTYPQKSNDLHLVRSIQSLKQLRSVGITVRQKIAGSLLEIDFRKFQIPPLALKIPRVGIDDVTSTILVNCVALEQCLPNEVKHFTAYVCFMHCLMKQPEDVGFLHSVEIITHVSQDEMCFINMLNSLGRNVSTSFSVRDSYIGKQFREIHSYYNSYWASIRRDWINWNRILQYCAILSTVYTILSWRLSANSSTSSVPN